MAVEKFSEQIELLRQQAAALSQRAGEAPEHPPGLMAVVFDELRNSLEELKIAEEELRQQNEELTAARAAVEAERQRYQDLFEFAPDAYLVTDAQGTIQEANRAAATLLGVEQQFLAGKPLGIFVVEEERSRFRIELNRQQQQQSVREWEVRMRSRQNTLFDAAVTVAVVRNWQGRPVALRWLLRDISDRKQIEEQMRVMQIQNLQLTETSRLQSQFLATMSHEFRTPLNAILGFSQLLLRQAQNHFSLKQSDMLTRILNNAQNLLWLIEDTLDFSKLEAGRLNLNLEDLNLEVLVTETCEELRSLAEQKQLDLHVAVTLSNSYIINDRLRLRQILVNLLSNAIKFTDSGSVSVEACDVSDEAIALIVRDTGIGIAPNDIKQIFKEFRQLNQSLSRQYSGTGLGLAITDWLVRLMNGKITVESILGEGSAFRVELPRQCYARRQRRCLMKEREGDNRATDAVEKRQEAPDEKSSALAPEDLGDRNAQTTAQPNSPSQERAIGGDNLSRFP